MWDDDHLEPPWMLDLPENQKQFYDPATFGAPSGESASDGPGRGITPCSTCDHPLARHPLSEACEDCACVWFATPAPIRPEPLRVERKQKHREPTMPAETRPLPRESPRASRILGSPCPLCLKPIEVGQSLRFDDSHMWFAHVGCLGSV